MKIRTASICIIAAFLNLGLYGYAFAAYMQGERPKSPIDVTTDKTDYYTGEVVKIDGRVPALTNGHEVNIIVKDVNGETFTKLRIKPTSDNKFEALFQIPAYDKLFPTGKWTINVSYNIWAAKVDINVLAAEKRSFYAVTVSKPEVATTSNTSDIRVGDKVMIISEVKNNEEIDQRIFYIVQVEDASGTTIFLNWLTRTLSANEIARFSVAWTPELEGRYTLETFAWDDIINPTPLSPARNVNQTVTGTS